MGPREVGVLLAALRVLSWGQQGKWSYLLDDYCTTPSVIKGSMKATCSS